jgi:two-component system sensor histidine kinase BaeS
MTEGRDPGEGPGPPGPRRGRGRSRRERLDRGDPDDAGWHPGWARIETERYAALRARQWRQATRAWQASAGWNGERPDWWPDEEPWPPHDPRPPWAHSRSRWARGFGCVFGLVFLLGAAGLFSLVTSVILAAGPLGAIARVLGVVILVAGGVGLAVAGRTFRRAGVTLDELVDAARRVEDGDYAIRVAEPSARTGPLWELVRGFNSMTGRLEVDAEQRRRLLADVSHELRTPLAVIQGNVEAILDGVHAADDANMGAILDETRVLARLVDDLRTVALSESGSLPLHREPTDLSILAAEAVASFQAAAETAAVRLEVRVDDDVPLLDVDPVRIREVLTNLVANALRHTPPGGLIDIRSTVSADGNTVEFDVRDTGSGIDPALLPHVFDRLAKAADSRGSGLGLAIARGLVEAHGGSIDVESTAADGTTFRFRLPVPVSPD